MINSDNVFNYALWLVLCYEGGYVNNKNDRGGATSRGITQATYDKYRRKKGLKRNPVRNIDDSFTSEIYRNRFLSLELINKFFEENEERTDEVKEIYLNEYWLAGRLQTLPILTALWVMDFNVMTGDDGTRIMQSIIGTKPDGVIGKKTLTKLAEYLSENEEWTLINRMSEERVNFHRRIVDRNPTQSEFIKGWLNRLRRLRGLLSEIRTEIRN